MGQPRLPAITDLKNKKMSQPVLPTLLFCLLFSNHCPAADKIVSIAFGESMSPYISEHGTSGMEVEIIRAALQARGYQLRAVSVSQPRLTQALQRPDVDAVATISQPSYPQAPCSSVYISYDNVAITLASHPLALNDLHDLARYRVQAFPLAKNNLGAAFAAMARHNPDYAESANQVDQNRLLYRGAIDVVIADRHIFAAMNEKMRQETDEQPQPVKIYHLFTPTPYRLAFKQTRLRDEFNLGLLAIQRNGQYQQISHRLNTESNP